MELIQIQVLLLHRRPDDLLKDLLRPGLGHTVQHAPYRIVVDVLRCNALPQQRFRVPLRKVLRE